MSSPEINKPEDKEFTHNFLSKFTLFCNEHVRIIKYPVYAIGAIGVYLIIRNTYVLKIFQKVSDIPSSYLRNHVTLQGTVKQVDNNSCLRIQHKPFVLNPLRKQAKDQECLPVHLAVLAIGPPGRHWLVQNIVDKHVWFKLFCISHEEVHCAVYMHKNFFRKMCVNHHLVKQGLCKISASHDHPQTKIYQKYHDKLIKLESKASKKGIGLWKVELKEKRDWSFWENMKAFLKRITTWKSKKT